MTIILVHTEQCAYEALACAAENLRDARNDRLVHGTEWGTDWDSFNVHKTAREYQGNDMLSCESCMTIYTDKDGKPALVHHQYTTEEVYGEGYQYLQEDEPSF